MSENTDFLEYGAGGNFLKALSDGFVGPDKSRPVPDHELATAYRLAHDVEFLTGTIDQLKSFAGDAPTLPIMSDVDMALMYLRHALKGLEGK